MRHIHIRDEEVELLVQPYGGNSGEGKNSCEDEGNEAVASDGPRRRFGRGGGIASVEYLSGCKVEGKHVRVAAHRRSRQGRTELSDSQEVVLVRLE